MDFARIESDIAELRERFDRQEACLEREGGLLQAGSRWVNRMNQWAERMDRVWDERKLEGNGAPLSELKLYSSHRRLA